MKKWSVRDTKKFIIEPSDIDHKYSRGTLGIITGSARFPGAAVLTTRAASTTGLGAIRFHSSSGLAHLVLHACPEVIVQPGKVDTWLLGSGIEANKYGDLSTWLRHRWYVLAKRITVPTLLDAGALHLAGTLKQPTLITPHARELERLMRRNNHAVTSEAIEGNPKRWAAEASQKLGVTVLLKGALTIVADEDRIIELPKASPWLATAGSGDVLAGIIAALMATNHIEILNDPSLLADVAAAGALIHATAADFASQGAPISASTLIDAITPALRSIMK